MSSSPPYRTRLLVVAVRFTRRDGQRPMGRVYLRRAGGRDRVTFEVTNPEDWHVGYYVEFSAQQLEPNLTPPRPAREERAAPTGNSVFDAAPVLHPEDR